MRTMFNDAKITNSDLSSSWYQNLFIKIYIYIYILRFNCSSDSNVIMISFFYHMFVIQTPFFFLPLSTYCQKRRGRKKKNNTNGLSESVSGIVQWIQHIYASPSITQKKKRRKKGYHEPYPKGRALSLPLSIVLLVLNHLVVIWWALHQRWAYLHYIKDGLFNLIFQVWNFTRTKWTNFFLKKFDPYME